MPKLVKLEPLRVATAAALLLLAALPARALTINASFDATINANPTAKATILGAIATYQSLFSDPITVNIAFQDMATGLGQSNTFYVTKDYATYQAALRADATSASDVTAMSHVPVAAVDPVTGSANIDITWAQAAAVGLSAPVGTNGTVSLNLALMNWDRVTINPGKVDLQAVASHEINEVLGTASGIGFPPNITPIDLFRYTLAGARTHTTTGDDAYFSIDGTTQLTRFNQTAGGDYGDLWSIGAHTPQVQDAFGTAGATPNLGVEIVMLDVVGYNLVSAVPEPSSMVMMFGGMLLIGGMARRRQQAA